jgi:hypothetical protein
MAINSKDYGDNPWAAFATAFLGDTAAYINARKDKAEDAEDTLRERAMRNQPTAEKYTSVVNAHASLGGKLVSKYGVPKAAVKALAASGPTGLKDAYETFSKLELEKGMQYVKDNVDLLVKGYDADDYKDEVSVKSFVDDLYYGNVGKLGDYEAQATSWFDKGMGIGAKDRMRAALDQETAALGMSVYDLANFSADSAYKALTPSSAYVTIPRQMGPDEYKREREDFADELDNFSESPQLVDVIDKIEALQKSIAKIPGDSTNPIDIEELEKKNSQLNALKEQKNALLDTPMKEWLISAADNYDDKLDFLQQMETVVDGQIRTGFTAEVMKEMGLLSEEETSTAEDGSKVVTTSSGVKLKFTKNELGEWVAENISNGKKHSVEESEKLYNYHVEKVEVERDMSGQDVTPRPGPSREFTDMEEMSMSVEQRNEVYKDYYAWEDKYGRTHNPDGTPKTEAEIAEWDQRNKNDPRSKLYNQTEQAFAEGGLVEDTEGSEVIQDDDPADKLLREHGSELMKHIMDRGATTDAAMKGAILEWCEKNNITPPENIAEVVQVIKSFSGLGEDNVEL